MKNYSIIVLYWIIGGSTLLNLGFSQNIQNINKQTVIDDQTLSRETQIVFIKNDLIPFDSSTKFSCVKKSIQNTNLQSPNNEKQQIIEINHPLIPYEERHVYYQEKKINEYLIDQSINSNQVIKLSPQPLLPYVPKK